MGTPLHCSMPLYRNACFNVPVMTVTSHLSTSESAVISNHQASGCQPKPASLMSRVKSTPSSIHLYESIACALLRAAGFGRRHVETILCSRLRKGPVLDPYKRRIMAMPDGGSVALDFEDLESCQDLPADAPVVILLPGAQPLHALCFEAKFVPLRLQRSVLPHALQCSTFSGQRVQQSAT